MQYQPGVCNIGKEEIRKRYAIAAFGFIIAILIIALVLWLHWANWYSLISIVPLLVGFEGLYQGYFKFCAGFAARGTYDFTGSGDSKGTVTDKNLHKKDIRKAWQIHIYSIISGVIVVIIVYFAIQLV